MVDIMLGDDLLSQVELTAGKLPDDVKSRNLKFDDKGTPVLQYRNEDGKLLKNLAIKNQDAQVERNDCREMLNEVEVLKDNSKRKNKVFTLIVGSLLALTLFSFYCILSIL